MEILYNLQQEINRLFIAGSKFAKADPRLQKHIPTLNKLGEKAPVFAKLAKDIEELLQTDSQQSAEKLMEISTLLYSILYTQGQTIEANTTLKEQIPNIPLSQINTEFSYLQLKPVIQALTTSNSGRLEILTDAFERNIFKDSRTFPYLNIALADKYSDLCDYIENTIIPSVGKAIIPFLAEGFKYEDKTENVRRLRLLNHFGYDQITMMIEKIFEENLPNLQSEAINILSNDSKNEEFITNLTSDKNKTIRGAAYRALAKIGTHSSLEKLYNLYANNKNKTNQTLLAEALSIGKIPFFFKQTYNLVLIHFEELLNIDKSDKKALDNAMDRFCTDMELFKNKDYPEVYDFFERIFTDKTYTELIKKAKLHHYDDTIHSKIIEALNTFDTYRVLSFYERNVNNLPSKNWYYSAWYNYFSKAVNFYPKEKIFDIFSPQFEKNISMSNLYGLFTNNKDFRYNGLEVYTDKTDPRWIEIFSNYIKNSKKWDYSYFQALFIVNKMEYDKEKMRDLIEIVLPKVPHDARIPLYEVIMEQDFKDKFKMIYDSIEKVPKNTYVYAFSRIKDVGFWTQFPKEYAEKFRNLYEKTKMEVYNEIAEEIENQK
ncbi:HEAT repeat domain-containing protein [Capnocytophaga cynodegmi]|uniref:HEAT repeat domain-containing protein n=1 Tax=Capnocytophaga cynodegmi TaxID=28189 RepID=UPI00385C524D